ncbi:MAG: tRNA (N(6)-L-threonylcarbamoyladenosine(37)-C(2))-methylthiotransferase MtaB [Bacteroidetes bacterium]|nr:tRNA (N(6)-L-threonylcarbamoyladenosine(37)-C(2))-methylthiotransferase MtaB [Bacteroidota bacterium]
MKALKNIAFYTLGCKLNYSETSTIGRQLEAHGFQTVPFEQAADVYVVNTCSVTDQADKKCRKVIQQAMKTSPDAFVAVIGCYAQLKPEEIASIPGVDLVLGASEKFNLASYLTDLKKKEKGIVHSCEIDEVDRFTNSWSLGERTRTFLKVQDGCDYNCSFCTIPLARGKSRSGSVASIIEEAHLIAENNIKEIVLSGVNIGDFGKRDYVAGERKENFLDLIQTLDEVKGIERFRISSIEPNLLSNEIIDFVAASKRFMPHFHVPLQSGSDKILSRMRRRYLSDLYNQRVEKIKATIPDACIGVDVIVGFPGESEKDFLDTYNFLNELDISYLHVFAYSERANTPAIDLDELVPVNERKKRSNMLRMLSEKKRRYFYQQHIGEYRKVLFEGEDDSGMMSGFTDNYIKVKSDFDLSLVNQLIEVRLNSIDIDLKVNIEIPQFV